MRDNPCESIRPNLTLPDLLMPIFTASQFILAVIQMHSLQTLQANHLIKFCQHYGVSADYILGLGRGMKWPR